MLCAMALWSAAGTGATLTYHSCLNKTSSGKTFFFIMLTLWNCHVTAVSNPAEYNRKFPGGFPQLFPLSPLISFLFGWVTLDLSHVHGPGVPSPNCLCPESLWQAPGHGVRPWWGCPFPHFKELIPFQVRSFSAKWVGTTPKALLCSANLEWGQPRALLTSRTNNARLCQVPHPPSDSSALTHCPWSSSSVHFCGWSRHFLNASNVSRTAAPGCQCKRNFHPLTLQQSCGRDAQRSVQVAVGFESRGKACAEFRGVTAGRVLCCCWDNLFFSYRKNVIALQEGTGLACRGGKTLG